MNLNQELSFNFKSANTLVILKFILLIAGSGLLLVSLYSALRSYQQIIQPIPPAAGGLLLNQSQVNAAHTLLQGKTVRYTY